MIRGAFECPVLIIATADLLLHQNGIHLPEKWRCQIFIYLFICLFVCLFIYLFIYLCWI